MKILNKLKFLALLLIVLLQFVFIPSSGVVYAATSPTLNGSSSFSVLGGAAITNVGTTTIGGAIGVSPGTSITGGTITAGGGVHSNDASAIAAQADISTATTGVWDVLDQGCDHSYSSGTDLTTISPLVPGVYCSAGSFLLTGNLTLTGTSGVWIFKTGSTLITSSGSSVTGGDPCNVWWRIGSAATLGTTTSFIGNILIADTASVNALQTGATLNGRILAQAGATVTLAGNTISGPVCGAAAAATNTTAGSSTTSYSVAPCVAPTISNVPIIIGSRRIDADSVFINWGPYTGTDTFSVRYGPANGNWLYNVNVTGFSTTLNSLPLNQPIWIEVAERNNCSIGTYSLPRLVGGPGLPNTGLASRQNNNIPWYIPVGIFLGISVLLVSVQRKQRFSSKH